MLAVARANLDQREARNCQVRHGDMYQLPLPDASFAAATLHQVLHYADDPFAALAEAARVLAPGGWLVVADLAHHEVERLRERSGHRRLGFGDEEIGRWFKELGLAAGEQRRLAGPELTVVIWTARRAPADADATAPITTRRSAA
jgi:ubiquinone/menaquinone biosynthesis C-methylase UbiE